MFWNTFYELCRKNNTYPLTVVKETGIATGSITKWKNGTVPSGATLQKLADYFAVPVDYLLGRENVPVPRDEIAELSACLTAEERRIVADYIRFLISQRKDAGSGISRIAPIPPRHACRAARPDKQDAQPLGRGNKRTRRLSQFHYLKAQSTMTTVIL